MNTRTLMIGGLTTLMVVTAGAGLWLTFHPVTTVSSEPVESAEPTAMQSDPSDPSGEPLPIPPVPPRIAEGEDYEKCLAMLNNDPAGANAFADAWEATGGGEGAVHCHALAQVALGNPEQGAAMMEKLASASQRPNVARASIFGQAGQAWMMAGEPARAFAASTLALSLNSDDPDLLIDRAIASATLERYEDAIDDLNHALDFDPRRAEAFVYRGAAWRHLNHLDLAQDDIDRALTLDPELPEALLERGILRQRQGDREGARRDWERAIALDPDGATSDLAQQDLSLLEAGPAR